MFQFILKKFELLKHIFSSKCLIQPYTKSIIHLFYLTQVNDRYFSKQPYTSQISTSFEIYRNGRKLLIRIKRWVEAPGIDPGTSRMLSERSTIWATPPEMKITFNLLLFKPCKFKQIFYFLNIISRCPSKLPPTMNNYRFTYSLTYRKILLQGFTFK